MKNKNCIIIICLCVFCLVLGIIIFQNIIFNNYNDKLEEQRKNISLDNEKYYNLGLVRGCDIGCIQYDLSINNFVWETSNEEYDIFNSDIYNECSKFCVAKYGKK